MRYPNTGDVMLTLPGNSGGFASWELLVRNEDRLYGYYPGHGELGYDGRIAGLRDEWSCDQGLIKIGEL